MTSKIRQLVLGHNRVDKELSISSVKLGISLKNPLVIIYQILALFQKINIPIPCSLLDQLIEQRSDIMEINARLIAHDFHLN